MDCVDSAPSAIKSSSISSGGSSSSGVRTSNVAGAALPVDDEDYLVPSPQARMQQQLQQQQHHPAVLTPTNNNAYMDLIGMASEPQGSAKVANQQATMFPYPPPQGYFLTDNPYNYGRAPDVTHPPSWDNPEYILNEQQQQRIMGRTGSGGSRGSYHTLGIPLVNKPSSPSASSSQGPSSLQSAPPSSAGPSMPHPPSVAPSQLAKASMGTVPRARRAAGGSASGASGEESDEHDYYNYDRQPLHPNGQQHRRTPASPAAGQNGGGNPLAGFNLQPLSKHETTV